MTRWTDSTVLTPQQRRLLERAGAGLPMPADDAARGKFGNTPVADAETGERIDSKREAKHRSEFRRQGRTGLLIGYAGQVELFLPGDTVMRIDHYVRYADGSERWFDSKGAAPTEAWRIKQRQVRALHGIEVELL